jgi:hypothetical protein
MVVLIVIIIVLLFPFTRCVIGNLHYFGYYTIKDIIAYIREKKWKVWNGWGLNIYVGLFGKGKTLSAVNKVYHIKKRFPYVHILTNVPLLFLDPTEYEMLENYKQIIDAPNNTVILIDEISTLFNSRAFKDFPVDMLFQILQCRKNRKQLLGTAQRFAHVDKLMRDITDHVIDCSKMWRYQRNAYYDAWDYENCMNLNLVKRLFTRWWFVRDKDYFAYDTRQLIKKDDFISNKEVLEKRCPTQSIYNSSLNRKGKKSIYGN